MALPYTYPFVPNVAVHLAQGIPEISKYRGISLNPKTFKAARPLRSGETALLYFFIHCLGVLLV
jgi:Mn-dependent DtxR family transcriptional regulator